MMQNVSPKFLKVIMKSHKKLNKMWHMLYECQLIPKVRHLRIKFLITHIFCWNCLNIRFQLILFCKVWLSIQSCQMIPNLFSSLILRQLHSNRMINIIINPNQNFWIIYFPKRVILQHNCNFYHSLVCVIH